MMTMIGKISKTNSKRTIPRSKNMLGSFLQGIYLNVYNLDSVLKVQVDTYYEHSQTTNPRDLYKTMSKMTLVHNAQSFHCIWDPKKPSLGQGCTSVIECLSSRGEALDWNPILQKNKMQQKIAEAFQKPPKIRFLKLNMWVENKPSLCCETDCSGELI